MAVEIREVKTRRELKKFVQFTIDLYKDNPYFIPPLISDEIDTLRTETNPAFDFCESIYYMAYRDGKPVGRIAGIINRVVNERQQARRARFGYVDFIDDTEVVDALFDTVEAWARAKGMNAMNGPLSFTDMDPEGMLVEGYDKLGTMATIYNYPYYVEHIARRGYEKEIDWVEYQIYIPEGVPEKHQRISDVVARKYQLRVLKYTDTKLAIKEYGQEAFDLINEAYSNLYGFSPLTQRQIDKYIHTYFSMLRLENVTLIVDAENVLVGVGIAMPSMSKALQKAKGHLFPFGFIHLLKALKGRNKIVELLLIAVKPEYQSKGVNALLFSDLIPVFINNGYEYAESNPEMEANEKVQSQWQYFDHVQHKRRRAFIKAL